MTHRPKIQLVQRSTLAKMKGCSPSAVTQQLKKNLRAAVVGDRVDVSHPVVVKWLTGGAAAPTVETPKADPAATRFSDLTLRKREAETLAIEARLARELGEVISRDGVRKHLFGALTELHMKLLGPVPTALGARLGGARLTREEIVSLARELISVELESCKQKMIRTLRSPTALSAKGMNIGKQEESGVHETIDATETDEPSRRATTNGAFNGHHSP